MKFEIYCSEDEALSFVKTYFAERHRQNKIIDQLQIQLSNQIRNGTQQDIVRLELSNELINIVIDCIDKQIDCLNKDSEKYGASMHDFECKNLEFVIKQLQCFLQHEE